MSNMKRSIPSHPEAVHRKSKEISSSEMESEKGDSLSSTLNVPESVGVGGQDQIDVEKSLDITASRISITKEEKVAEELVSLKGDHSSNLPKRSIPDLMITSENDIFSSNSGVMTSLDSSSPKLPTRGQHLVKALHALPVSDTSHCPTSQISTTRSKILPSFYSPKLGRRFESVPDYKSVSSSPTSPSRKYYRFMSSPTSFGDGWRRGSEPLLDGRDLTEVQLSMTDRRWEKLRSILVAMKSEPFDVDSAPGFSTPDMTNLKEDIEIHQELSTLRKELSALHVELELKDGKLSEALNDRNIALDYIKKLKLKEKELNDENSNKLSCTDENSKVINPSLNEDLKKDIKTSGCSIYVKELETLEKAEATKGDVFSVLTRVVEELRVERSYLNHLMSVVLDRAPWMLDEVDRGGHWMEDCTYSSEDDEVWC